MKVELRNVTKTYGRVAALDHFSWEIPAGKLICLVGLNGAGKTTLLRMLSGLVAPAQGNVLMDGEELLYSRLDLRSRIHFLPDFPVVFLWKNAVSNISIVLRLYGADGAGMEDKVLTLLEEFSLLPYAFKPLQQLSRGQAYKVGLVTLIALDRDLWILDEPLASGMDPEGIDAFKRHALAAVARGRTVVYTTQLLEVAETFSDQVAIIDKGQLLAFEPLAQMRQRVLGAGEASSELFKRLRETKS